MTILSKQSDHLRFSILSTFFAFILGIYWYTIPIASDRIRFFISLPIASFISCFFIWKWIVKSKEDYSIGNIIALAFVLTLVTSFLNFELLAVGRKICGDVTNYHGQTETLLETFVYFPLLQFLISMYYVGIVGLVVFTSVGIYVVRTSRIE